MDNFETKNDVEVTSWIKTIEDLSKSILNDPDRTESFHKFIEEKYWLQSSQEILNVTHNELEDLKNEVQSGNTDFENIWKLVYEDYIETQLETKGLESVNLNIITQGINTPRLNEIKQNFEAYFDDAFNGYDFISPSQKELFKISIANKLLDSQMSSIWTSMMWGLNEKITWAATKLQEWEYSEAISSFTDTSKFSEWSDMMKVSLDATMKNYTDKLDSIKQLIQDKYANLNVNQLQNVFSNINEFKDPLFIENNIENFDITTIDFTQTEEFNTEINTENIKEYILNSRENISEVADKLSQWDKMQEVVLDLISDKNFWGAMKGFLGILMELPIIGDMISIFLWLDKKDPMGSLEMLSWKYNFFNWLLEQGLSESKNWKEEWKWIFENINFWEQGFQENKWIIEKIMKQLPQLDEKSLSQFWQDSFSKDWLELKWVHLKFEWLEDSDNFENWVMKQWVLNDLLQQWFINYENDLGSLEIAEKQKEQDEKDKIKTEKITELEKNKTESEKNIFDKNSTISTLSSLLNYSDMSHIDDWDDIFNIWDITDIPLSEIMSLKNPQDAVKLIEEQLWDNISKENKWQITELCNQIILYLTHKNLDKDIETIWDLYDNSSEKSKEFFEYVSWKIEREKKELKGLQWEDKNIIDKLTKLWVQPTQAEKLASELLFIEEWKLSEWVKFWDNSVKYNSENWELLVWDINYQLFYNGQTDNIFSDISVNEWIVTFYVLWQEKKATKFSVLKFLQDTLLSEEKESIFISWDNKITLKKRV